MVTRKRRTKAGRRKRPLACPEAFTLLKPKRTRKSSATDRRTAQKPEVSEAERRVAIKVAFLTMGSPPRQEWSKRNGTIYQIMKSLKIPPGSRQTVETVLASTAYAEEKGLEYDATKRKPGSGTTGRKLTREEIAFDAACEALDMGFSYDIAAAAATDSDPDGVKYNSKDVSRAVQRELRAPCVKTPWVKTGSRDPDSNWAKARFVFATELRRSLSGEDTGLGLKSLNQVLWVDEHHRKVSLGGPGHETRSSKTQVLIPRHPETGKPCPVEDGGVLPEVKKKVKAKYMGEARGMFGVAAPKFHNGEVRAARMTPFDYSGKTVIGFTKYNALLESELRRVKRLKGGGWPAYAHCPNPYVARWGKIEGAKRLQESTMMKKYCSGTDLVEHVIREGERLFKGSIYQNNWMIMHDHLKVWWERGVQTVLEQHGFKHRQLRIMSQDVAPCYRNTLPGDSPEMMPLDTSLFCDFQTAVGDNVNMTYKLERSDPRKFSMATPKLAWSSMERTWRTSPSDERIVHDIMKVEEHISEIIKAKGCIVEGIVRKGHRNEAARLERARKRRETAMKSLERL